MMRRPGWPWFGSPVALLSVFSGLVLFFPDHHLTVIVALANLFYATHFFGKVWFPDTSTMTRWILSLLTLIGGTVLVQCAWYYSDGYLSTRTDGASVITALILFYAIHLAQRIKAPLKDDDTQATQRSSYILLWSSFFTFLACACVAFLFWQAIHHQALDPIRTPWSRMPAGTMIVFALLASIPWLVAKKLTRSLSILLVITLSLASVTWLLLLLYPLGFGFDGFLHRASEHVLLSTGTLSPKPLYYMGQYTLLTWLSRWLSFPLRWLDIFLVPLTSLLIPLAAAQTFSDRISRSWGLVGLISLLPLGAFITTTPQSFAYILGLMSLCLIMHQSKRRQVVPALILGSWSVVTHPLAGLPFLGTVLCLFWMQSNVLDRYPRRKQIVLWIGGLLTVLSVPIALFIHSLTSSAHIAWSLHPFFQRQTYVNLLSALFVPERTHIALWADWASWTTYLFPLLLIGLTGYAIKKDETHRSSWLLLAGVSLGSAVMGALLRMGSDFTFLIAYERSSYAERLWIIALLFLFIPALHGVAHLAKTYPHRSRFSTLFLVIVFSAFQAGHIYASFPRHDAIEVGHGWSAGISDRDAVRYIEQNAGGKAYTVLANQQVSAMAIEQYGFKRYIGDVFYYPVPTGGPLYQLFLNIMQQPNFDTIKEAAQLGQSSLVYVILNDYWWEADRVADELAELANQQRGFGNGRVRVYRFEVTSDKKR